MLLGIWMGLILASSVTGRYRITPDILWGMLFERGGSAMDRSIFFQIRLPRTLLVAVSGGGLAVAGLVYQTIFDNPIVSPDVLGVSSGCSVGAVLAILYGGGSLVVLQWMSFAVGIVVVVLAIIMTAVIGENKLYGMILSGIILGALMNSVLMLLKYAADPNRQLPVIEYWLMGSFSGANWEDILVVLPMVFLAGVLLYVIRWKLKLLTLGDEDASSLGISVGVVRVTALAAATILVSAVVSVSGVVSWIGLIAPHIARMISTEDITENFPAVILVGSCLLLFADILARSLLPSEIPISILTSFFGAMVLLIFLWRRSKSNQINGEWK